MKNYILNIALLFAVLNIVSCNKKEEITVSKTFCISDTLMSKIVIDTVKTINLQDELRLYGKITFNEDKVVKVYPLTGGHVKELKVELGDKVRKGEVLAWVWSPDIANFENEMSAAKSNLELAKKTYQVSEELFKTGNVSEKEKISAQKELEKAQSEYNRIDQIIQMYGADKNSVYPIVSPADGFVVEKNISQHMEIRTENTEHVFTISNLENVWVIANVYESDIAKIKEGYKAEVNTISFPDKIFNAKVDKIFNVIDPETKVMKAKIILNNADFLLKPEMFATTVIKNTLKETMTSVPSNAVIFDKNKNFVMLFNEKCKIETREVEVFKTIGNITYIKSGVKEGEKVISKYQLLVYDALND